MIAGFVKSFNVPFETVLEMPYVNLIMYTRTLPSYDTGRDTDKDNNKKLSTKETNEFLRKLTSKK